MIKEIIYTVFLVVGLIAIAICGALILTAGLAVWGIHSLIKGRINYIRNRKVIRQVRAQRNSIQMVIDSHGNLRRVSKQGKDTSERVSVR